MKELDLEIGKRKRIAAVKALLKKGTIDKLKERTKSAQTILSLSNQTYSR